MRMRRLIFLSVGHMMADFFPGMLAPLLPLIVERHDLTHAGAGMLIMVLQMFCSFSQPAFGIINDHRSMKSFLWAGLIIAAVPFCFLLRLERLEMMIGALVISGLGVGMSGFPIPMSIISSPARRACILRLSIMLKMYGGSLLIRGNSSITFSRLSLNYLVLIGHLNCTFVGQTHLA